MVSQKEPRVLRSNSYKGPIYPDLSWKRAKKKPKGQTKILGPASVVWHKISEIWPQKGQPGTLHGRNFVAKCGGTAWCATNISYSFGLCRSEVL